MRRILLVLLAAVVVGGLAALPALATHESNNTLTFAPVAASPSPDASGAGVINYVKGLSGDEPNTAWTSSFRFQGLAPNATYTVVVRGRFADPTVFSAICSFTTDAAGAGSCSEQFTGLQRLAIAQLRIGGAAGTPVLQATRQAVVAGPGEIVSRGDCREPDQGGSICQAPGRQ